MEVKNYDNKYEWDKWLINQNQSEFLQSFEWGEFQTIMGNKVIRLGGNGWQVQGFEHQLGLGFKYFYIPRLGINNVGIKELVEFCGKNKYAFLRIEPLKQLSYALGPVAYTHNRQPKQTLVLDLTKTEEEILALMHPKTRYNIHIAERHGVVISQEKNADIFWQLNLETTTRDSFRSHDKKYYERMLDSGISHQLTAYYKGKPIASNILISFGDTIVYLHGASSGDWRNLMAPYLLQWEGLKLGKSLGCKFYDFWGVAPRVFESDIKQHSCFYNLCWEVNHPWSGVTRFKAGFGAEYKEYPEACDIILKKWQYTLYKLVRKLKI